MYNPTTRVLAALELLQSRGRLTGPELAERLEVDLRTVRRYVTMLQDLGIPVEGERGRHGGYRLKPGYKLPPLMFTDDEALAVMLGLLAAQRLGLAATAPAVEGALTKLERVLPPALRDRIGAVHETLVTDLAPAPAAPATAVVVALGAATRESRRVWLRYGDGRGERSEREFDPYGLVHLAGRWYVVGHCHLRRAERVFRLDRVLRVEPRDGTFVRPAGFDAMASVRASLSAAPRSWSVEVVLEVPPEVAQGVVPKTLLVEDLGDGRALLRGHVECLDWLARVLVGMEFPFVVRAPAELRAELLRLATRVAAFAAREDGVAREDGAAREATPSLVG